MKKPIRIAPWMLRDLASFALAAVLAGAAFLLGDMPPEGGLFPKAAGVATGGAARSLTAREALFVVLIIASYLAAGWNVVLGAARNIARGQMFDELFLMTVATFGALAIGQYEEALGVMVFYKVGEVLQEVAQARSRASIRSILDLRPEKVRVRSGSEWIDLAPDQVGPGDEYMVTPGERVALDAVVLEGESWMDTSAITGEPEPRRAAPGDPVSAGFISTDGWLVLRAERPASESQVARIMRLVEDATRSKARIEGIVSRFASIYTPIVVYLAAATAFLPPLLIPGQDLATWIYRALVMLVISCPCALVISVPLGYFGGLGGAARRGILVKGSEVMDALAKARTVVFDKTGTLTEGKFRVRRLSPAPGVGEEYLLRRAAEAEGRSSHPVAAAIRAEAASRLPVPLDESVATRESAGAGVVARFAGSGSERRVSIGNSRLMESEGVEFRIDVEPLPGLAGGTGDGGHGGGSPTGDSPAGDSPAGGSPAGGNPAGDPAGDPAPRAAEGSVIHVAEGSAYLGSITVGDADRPDAAAAVDSLKAMGAGRIVMLTGDAHGPAGTVAAKVGVTEVHAHLLPEDKLRILETVIAETAAAGGTTIFVGDGVNDAPVLARADAGIAMGSGADAAVENADVVLLSGGPSRVAEAIARARRTHAIVTQNIVFALGFKAVFLALGAVGLASMWGAVIADVGVALLATANSLRALR